ncbi:MAG TPA: YtxH domain-containing protein [Syntrophorhabdaceae bacterium]|nr:YtxH domain-containing protein [Syntrophorhabdaceae bacterium]
MVRGKNYQMVSCAISFLTGALLGSGIALLAVPQYGKVIRRELKDVTKRSSETDCGTDDKRRIDEAARKIHDYYEEANHPEQAHSNYQVPGNK